MRSSEDVGQYEQAAIRLARERGDLALDVTSSASGKRGRLQGKGCCGGIYRPQVQLERSCIRIEDDGNATCLRGNLLQQFEPFPSNTVVLVIGKTGDVAPGPGEALHQA